MYKQIMISAALAVALAGGWAIADEPKTATTEAAKPAETATPALRQQFLDQGLLIRPLGKTIYLLPPYCVTSDEIQESFEKIRKILFLSL